MREEISPILEVPIPLEEVKVKLKKKKKARRERAGEQEEEIEEVEAQEKEVLVEEEEGKSIEVKTLTKTRTIDEPKPKLDLKAYHCRKCRCFLFDSTHLISHEASAQQISYRKLDHRKSSLLHKSPQLSAGGACSSFFLNDMIISEMEYLQNYQGGIDLLNTMDISSTSSTSRAVKTTGEKHGKKGEKEDVDKNDENDEDINVSNQMIHFSDRPTDFITSQISLADGTLEGKLICINHRCRARIGSFNWSSGSQCSCGSWVSPAIQIPKSKVDEKAF